MRGAVLLLVLILSITFVFSGPRLGPCSFQASAGFFYDLSGMRREEDYTLNAFRMNICQQANCDRIPDAASCMRDSTTNAYENFGSIFHTKFLDSVRGPDRGVTLIYEGGTFTANCPLGRSTIMYVHCNEDIVQGSILSAKLVGECHLEIVMESQFACPLGKLVTWDRIEGFQIASIVFVLIIFLFLAGIVAMLVCVMSLRRQYITLRP